MPPDVAPQELEGPLRGAQRRDDSPTLGKELPGRFRKEMERPALEVLRQRFPMTKGATRTVGASTWSSICTIRASAPMH